MRASNELLHNIRVTTELHNRWQDADGKLRCINCGCESHIRWHHVVPLGKGGIDTITNIVPVCDRCHAAIHTDVERHYSDDRVWGGRPRKIPQNWREILTDYANCRIGKQRMMEMLGIKAADITDRIWYREFLDEHGVKSIRNNLDIIRVNGRRKPFNGECVGYVTMKDGTVWHKYFKEVTHGTD